MCQISILPNLITNVQFLCGERILSSGAEELGFNAEIMLCSNSKNYPKLLEVYKELLEESELMLMEINAQMSEIFLMLCLEGYEEFSNCPDLYEIVLGDFGGIADRFAQPHVVEIPMRTYGPGAEKTVLQLL